MRRIVIALILGVISCSVKAQETIANDSPYALFGDSTKTLKATIRYQSDELCIPVLVKDTSQAKIVFDFQKMTGKLIDGKGEILAVDTLNETQRGMFISIDPYAKNYYHVSPYAYCMNNPVNAIDPDGRSIYMLFYTEGNHRGDEMFRTAAETRKYDIEHSDFFNASNDIVILSPIQDLANIGKLVGNIIDSYSENFGGTAEFSIWSHAGLDGPTGTLPTSKNAIADKQMSVDGWGSINFNWEQGANANFYGCKTGVGSANAPSFTTRLSAKANFHNVTVHGQSSSAYPSIYANARQNTSEMMDGNFSYPTYMVGGNSLGIIGRFFPTFSPAYPMRSSINGKGKINNYYQPGRRY